MTSPAAKPEFSRPVAVAELDPGGTELRAKAGPAELAALARRFGARATPRLSVEARIRPESDGWRVSGLARARVTQSCVLTLEDVDQVIETRFERVLLPGAPVPDIADLRPDEGEDPPEPLGAVIDPAEMAVEAVALALDPYPRRKGVEFEGRIAAAEGADGAADEPVSRPFEALSALREKLQRDGGG